MAEIWLPPQLATSLGAALRALANKADKGEVKTFHMVFVDAAGKPFEAFKLDPEVGNRDVNILGNVLCDRVEKLQEFVESKQRIHAGF